MGGIGKVRSIIGDKIKAMRALSLPQLMHRFMHINWTVADQACVSGVNFLTGLLLARGLGISAFGIFSLAWVVVLFANSLQFAMISAPMLSIAQKIDADGKAGYFGSVVLQQLAFATTAAVLVWLGVTISGSFFPDAGLDPFALPLAFVTFAVQTRDFVRRYFFASNRHLAAFVLDANCYGGQFAVLVALFMLDELTIISTFWTITLVSAIAVVGAAFAAGPFRFSGKELVDVARRHWLFSRWLGASALLHIFADHFLLVVSGAFIGTTAAGALKASQNLMGIAQLMFFALENIVPARAGWQFQHGGIKALIAFLKRSGTACLSVTALIVVIFCTDPEFWLRLIFGEQFAGYGMLVRLYGLAFLLKAVGFTLGAGLYALENTRPIFVAYCLGTAASLAVIYPLLENFGVTGAAIGTVLVEVTMVSVIAVGFTIRARRLRQEAAAVSPNP